MNQTFYQIEQRVEYLFNKKKNKHHDNAAAIVEEWIEAFAHEETDGPIEILWVPNFDQLTY